MHKHVYLDIHGVLADFNGHAASWFGLQLSPEDRLVWSGIIDSYKRKYRGKQDKEFWDELTPPFWETIPFTLEAAFVWNTALITLQKRTSTRYPTLITSPSHNSATAIQVWIRENLPFVFHAGEYIITPNKGRVGAPGRLLIDDSGKNIHEWEEAGGTGLLFPRSWNRNRNLDMAETLNDGLHKFFEEE